MKLIDFAPQISEALNRGDDFWTIHLDELDEWQPAEKLAESWIAASVAIFQNARKAFTQIKCVVIAINLLPTEELMTHFEVSSVDFFTPPVLYLMREKFEYPDAEERFELRIRDFDEIVGNCYFTSAISPQAKANNWEYDNTLYFVSSSSPV